MAGTKLGIHLSYLLRHNPGALELDMDQTADLIGRAGYALTQSSKFDLIIQYHIENKKYEIAEAEGTLEELGFERRDDDEDEEDDSSY